MATFESKLLQLDEIGMDVSPAVLDKVLGTEMSPAGTGVITQAWVEDGWVMIQVLEHMTENMTDRMKYPEGTELELARLRGYEQAIEDVGRSTLEPIRGLLDRLTKVHALPKSAFSVTAINNYLDELSNFMEAESHERKR